jgi:hypothetical protein
MIELMSFSCISEEVSNSDSLSNVDIYYVDVEDLLDDGGCGLRFAIKKSTRLILLCHF